MITTDSFSEFVELLATVPNREHGMYIMLLRRANELSLPKLRVLLTGADNTGKHLWGRQNSFDPSLRQYAHLFDEAEWSEIMRKYQEQDVYQYRASDKPNSHGHCNSNPSDWAISGEWKVVKFRFRSRRR